ncbi:MAG: glycoside hydrolase family 3 protein [Ilumatobacter sp.]|nr:glycoside hydrolase family 3 protein [Ilumatobacter sp.]
MGSTVDLTASPYDLDRDQIDWVESTIAGMSDEEKVGQLFFNLFHFGGDSFGGNDLSNREILERFHIGGARYHGGDAAQIQALINEIQANTKIPLLIAANFEMGTRGGCNGGTYVATAAQAVASGDPEVAYDTGLVSAREGAALGVNVNFWPCVDILMDWRNTIINSRAFGTTADEVITYSDALRRGWTAEHEMITCIKHFPGDGVEERDQHLILGINDLSVDEWEATFGTVYRHHIDAGVEMIMAGHIALPAYQQHLNPDLTDADILPASLAPELIDDLLKTRLGFNGLVVTDASHMLGMTSAMRRADQVPGAIAAGCDMFLFFNDLEEDFGYMLAGYRNGTISEERMIDALRRILGLKAKLRLIQRQTAGELVGTTDELAAIGAPDHLERQRRAADLAITLVKDTAGNLPIRPETQRRIRLYYLDGGEKNAIFASGTPALQVIVAELESRGFEVTVNDNDQRVKGKVEDYRNRVDAALVFSNVRGYAAENVYRIRWSIPMSNACPWYVHEVPTVFVSLNYTTHLYDVPMVKTYINAYDDNPETIRQVISKIMGDSKFTGLYNDHVWAGQWQSRL